MKCKYCGTDLVKGIEVCHNCGRVNKVKTVKKMSLIAGSIVFVVVIIVAAIAIFNGICNKVDLYPAPGDEDGDTWGYVNIHGEWIIEPEYIESTKAYLTGGYAKDFHEGLAAFLDKETGLYGYIDENGEWVIEPQFIDAGDFSEGYAAVSKESWIYYKTYNYDYSEEDLSEMPLYGYINKNGEVVIEPKYAHAREFVDGYARVNEITDVEYDNVVYFYNVFRHDVYFSTQNGREYIPTGFTENCDRFELKHIDKSGEEADPGYPEGVYELYDNRCIFDDPESNLCGFYDESGNIAITPKYSEAENFSEGLALVIDERSQLYGFIDTDGNYVIKPKYEWAKSFLNGVALVYYYDDEKDREIYQYIDKKGNIVIEPNYFSWE